MNAFCTRKYGIAPELFREQPGTTNPKSENPQGIVRLMIPIRKRSSLFVRPAFQLTQTGRRPLTVSQSHETFGIEIIVWRNHLILFPEKTWHLQSFRKLTLISVKLRMRVSHFQLPSRFPTKSLKMR